MESMKDKFNSGETKYILEDGREVSEAEYLEITRVNPKEEEVNEDA